MQGLSELKEELDRYTKEAQDIKDKIAELNSLGREISYHCTYLKGKIDCLQEHQDEKEV